MRIYGSLIGITLNLIVAITLYFHSGTDVAAGWFVACLWCVCCIISDLELWAVKQRCQK